MRKHGQRNISFGHLDEIIAANAAKMGMAFSAYVKYCLFMYFVTTGQLPDVDITNPNSYELR